MIDNLDNLLLLQKRLNDAFVDKHYQRRYSKEIIVLLIISLIKL